MAYYGSEIYGNIILSSAPFKTPNDLYNALLQCWCADTCAPRMRDKWSPSNPTWGQCSITAFLVQDIFGGAYVLLPQSETVWMDDGSGSYTSDGTSRYTESLKGLLDKFIADHPGIDTDRIYIGGCSNGGFMTLKMAMEYPEMFAACFPVCEAYQDAWISDDEINTLKEIPTWFVHCASDPVVDISKTADATYQRLVKAGAEDLHFTKYDEIKDPDFGNSYIGHFAWVYSLKNLCKTDYDGEPVEMDGKEVTLYEWLAAHTKK